MYELPSSLRDLRVFHLIVSQEEYQRYLNIRRLRCRPLSKIGIQTLESHAPHVRRKFLQNTQMQKYEQVRSSKSSTLLKDSTLQSLPFHFRSHQSRKQTLFSEEKFLVKFVRQITQTVILTSKDWHCIMLQAISSLKQKCIFLFPLKEKNAPVRTLLCTNFSTRLVSHIQIMLKSVLWDTASCTNNKIIPEDIALLKGIYG